VLLVTALLFVSCGGGRRRDINSQYMVMDKFYKAHHEFTKGIDMHLAESMLVESAEQLLTSIQSIQ
jgi:hypothetical protein